MMSIDFLLAMLLYAGIGLVLASVVVAGQLVFLDAATRFGRWLLPLVPVLGWTSMALTIVFSHRNLNSQLLGSNPAGDQGSAWINRGVTAVLMAIAVGKVVESLYQRRQAYSTHTHSNAGERANRRLFVAMLAFVAASLVLPMMFSAHPGFAHDGIPAALAMVAIYMARREPLDRFVAGAKWTLFLVMLASLAVAIAHPDIAIEKNYGAGWIPGLRIRLWGLAAHANTLGALTLYFMLTLLLQPARSRAVNMLMWGAMLLVLLLSQSKTSWGGAALVGFIYASYNWGRDPRGGLRPAFIIGVLLSLAGLASLLMVIDPSRVLGRFMDTDTGANLTTLTGRTEIWAAAYGMWLDSPAFGYGLEAWSPLHRLQLGLPFATHAHNQFMQALAIGGVFDALALLAYIVLLVSGAVRAARRTHGVSLGLMALFLLRCVTEVPLEFSNITAADVVAHLLLFALIVNEHRPSSDAEAQASMTGSKLSSPMGRVL